jgi:hypothetical protein
MHAVCSTLIEQTAACNCTAGDTRAPVVSVALQPRSLLVFRGDAYTHCLHGIDEVRSVLLLLLSCQGSGQARLICLE